MINICKLTNPSKEHIKKIDESTIELISIEIPLNGARHPNRIPMRAINACNIDRLRNLIVSEPKSIINIRVAYKAISLRINIHITIIFTPNSLSKANKEAI